MTPIEQAVISLADSTRAMSNLLYVMAPLTILIAVMTFFVAYLAFKVHNDTTYLRHKSESGD